MISPVTRLYLRIEAYRNHIKLARNYKEMLYNEIKQFNYWDGWIGYVWFWFIGIRYPNASATIPKMILLNEKWAWHIIYHYDNAVMHNAFKLTVCHEMTHQEDDFYFYGINKHSLQFVNWVNEVHADYGGIIKAFGRNVEEALEAMEYKRAYKCEDDIDTFSHPSWERRKKYIEKYDFDYELIECIAKETMCNDDRLVKAVKEHFRAIILSRSIN